MAQILNISSVVQSLLNNDNTICEKAIENLLKIANNILSNPDSDKFRSLSLNSTIMDKILLPCEGALEILFLMGFEESGDKLILPIYASLTVVKRYRDEIVLLSSMRKKILSARRPKNSGVISDDQLLSEIAENFNRVLRYELPSLQEKARQCIPFSVLNNRAKEMLKTINDSISHNEKPLDFQWYNKGYCKKCEKDMNKMDNLEPLQEELMFGGTRVEGYICSLCGSIERFPRYNDAAKLLETRKGRCGEWANCFTLICRAVGMDARWLHTDPCENKLDSPLMYEAGWGKELSYVIAYSKDEVLDVTWRYTNNPKRVKQRRTRCSDDWLAKVMLDFNKTCQASFSDAKRHFLQQRYVNELCGAFGPPRNVKQDEKEGRISGSLEWRLSRKETVINSYIFILNSKEIEQKEFILKYNTAEDKYIRPFDDSGGLFGWQNSVYFAENLIRKHETDWKMVYLSRNELSDQGEVKWRVEWPNTELRVHSILVVLQHATFENGIVAWQMCIGDLCFMGNKEGVLEVKNEQLTSVNSTYLEITSVLKGGEGSCAWQHAQLFRLKDSLIDQFPFLIHIKYI